MLKAKLDSVRKNKKGFSLVELIIVIAIMVALIAVMAPAFVKYVQKSRDSALTTAAESLYTTIQTYYGDPDTTDLTPVNVKVYVDGTLQLDWTDAEDAEVTPATTAPAAGAAKSAANAAYGIITMAGIDQDKGMGATDKAFQINVTKDAEGFHFAMTEVTTDD